MSAPTQPQPNGSHGEPSVTSLREVITRQPGGIVVVDGDGLVRFANPAAEQLLGVDGDGLVGQAFGFPLSSGEATDVNVFSPQPGVRTAAMQVTELSWDGQPASLVTLYDVSGRTQEYEREHRIVETLQRSLLPQRMPLVAGVNLAARYLPGGVGADIGGDWYDAIPLPDGTVALAIGDVAGHGLEAASMMGQLRNALRAYAVERHSPAAVVERLDSLVDTLEQGRMATLLYIVVDPRAGRVRWANAGHPPPLVIGPDGEATFLEGARTTPLGVRTVERDEASAELRPGSSLVLYTDGLIERRDSPIDDGLERLRVAALAAPEGPDALSDHVVTELLKGQPASDDVAVLTLQTVSLSGDRLTLKLSTEAEALAAMRRMLDQWLTQTGASADETRDIQFACHEACSNAVEHGYRFAEASFDVYLLLNGRAVSVTVRDTGGWREPTPDTDRGRGIALMKALMDDVEIVGTSDGTVVNMTRELGRRASKLVAATSVLDNA